MSLGLQSPSLLHIGELGQSIWWGCEGRMPHALALPPTGLPTPQFEMLNAELEENQELAKSRMAELEKLQAELQGAVRTNERLKVSCVWGWEGISLQGGH